MELNCPQIGENVEFDLSQIAKNAFKLYTMVGENSQQTFYREEFRLGRDFEQQNFTGEEFLPGEEKWHH